MRYLIVLGSIVYLLAPPAGFGDSASTAPVKSVCGNTDSGIVVGKPKLFDERTMAILIDSLEARLNASPGLGEQTALSYQIANLRALSERAPSERVARRALAGFQISVDPAEKYANALAEVEITIVSKGEARQAPTLISLLPKDKTYNVATVAKDAPPSSAEGTAQPVSGNPDGAYLLKDSDTIALERMNPAQAGLKTCSTGYRESERDLTFAWRFKPVFGRDKVSAGARQVYAYLALPASAAEEYIADIYVHTYWRSMRPVRRRAISDLIEDSSRDELWTDAIRFNALELEQALKPKVNSARFVYNGKDEVQVLAEGESFLPDTGVRLGSSEIARERLKIERERHLQFSAAAPMLARGDLYLTGHFGSPVPLVDPRALQERWTFDPSWGLKIEHARARPKNAEISEVRIKLKSRQKKKPLAEMIVNKTLVDIGGRVYPVSSLENEPTDSDALMIRFNAPTASLRGSPRVTVVRLFGGELYRDSSDVVLEDDITAGKVNLLSATDDDVTLSVDGSGFSNLAAIRIGGVTYTRWTKPALELNGASMLTLKLKRAALQGARQLVVTQGFAQPVTVPLPEIPPSSSDSSRTKSRRRS